MEGSAYPLTGEGSHQSPVLRFRLQGGCCPYLFYRPGCGASRQVRLLSGYHPKHTQQDGVGALAVVQHPPDTSEFSF